MWDGSATHDAFVGNELPGSLRGDGTSGESRTDLCLSPVPPGPYEAEFYVRDTGSGYSEVSAFVFGGLGCEGPELLERIMYGGSSAAFAHVTSAFTAASGAQSIRIRFDVGGGRITHLDDFALLDPSAPPTVEDTVADASSVIAGLAADAMTPQKAARRLGDADRLLASALRKWEAGTGKKALSDLRRAIGKLEDAIAAGIPPSSLDPTIDGMLALIRQQAEDEIEAAIDRMGKASRIEVAQNRLDRGDAASSRPQAAQQYVTAYTKAKGA